MRKDRPDRPDSDRSRGGETKRDSQISRNRRREDRNSDRRLITMDNSEGSSTLYKKRGDFRSVNEKGRTKTSRTDSNCHHTPRLDKGPRPNAQKGAVARRDPDGWKDFLRRQKSKHEDIKLEAPALWERLDAPVYDSPLTPEYGFSEKEIVMAKRGRRCSEETAVFGSTKTRKAIRDHERSAACDVGAEIERLSEYPRSRRRYVKIVSGLHERVRSCG